MPRIVVGGIGLDTAGSEPQNRLSWTQRVMAKLDVAINDELWREILSTCACQFPQQELRIIRKVFRVTGDLELAHAMLQDHFERFLKEELHLDAGLRAEIKQREWGSAGKFLGATIVVTRIPNPGNLVAYFNASTAEERRRLYCHCPRILDAVRKSEKNSTTYCYCGAGFYQHIWEEIIGTKVDIEVLESILGGGDVCRFAIFLPLDVEHDQPY